MSLKSLHLSLSLVLFHTNEKKDSNTNIITAIDMEWIKNFTEKKFAQKKFFYRWKTNTKGKFYTKYDIYNNQIMLNTLEIFALSKWR